VEKYNRVPGGPGKSFLAGGVKDGTVGGKWIGTLLQVLKLWGGGGGKQGRKLRVGRKPAKGGENILSKGAVVKPRQPGGRETGSKTTIGREV